MELCVAPRTNIRHGPALTTTNATASTDCQEIQIVLNHACRAILLTWKDDMMHQLVERSIDAARTIYTAWPTAADGSKI